MFFEKSMAKAMFRYVVGNFRFLERRNGGIPQNRALALKEKEENNG
ncbi:MAG: hypothetical protein AAB296_04975 [Candidatus Desantisbacteria bacterium]